MFTIDVPELKGQMAKKGTNIVGLSRCIGVDRNTLSSYFSYPGKMPYKVMTAIMFELDLTNDEAMRIFFHRDLT